MGLILDASVFIEAEHRRFDLRAWLLERPAETAAVAVITWSEVWHGVWRAKTARERRRRRQWAEEILKPYPLLVFNRSVAEHHARLWATVVAAGRTPGAHDLLVAAHALYRGDHVVTFNGRHFEGLPGVGVINLAKA
jgi:predicted nucleic acid-binding protein